MKKINIFHLVFYAFIIGIGTLLGMKTGENIWRWGKDEVGKRNPQPSSKGNSTSSSRGDAK